MTGDRRGIPTGALLLLKIALDVCLALSAALLLITTIGSDTLAYAEDVLPVAPGYMLAVSVVLRIMISRTTRQLVTKLYSDPAAPSAAAHVSDDFIVHARDSFEARYGLASSTQLVKSLTNPTKFFDRIKERVEIQTSRYEKRTTLIMSADPQTEYIIPILAQPKGVLVDDLDLQVDGKPCSTLPYRDNQGAVILAVELLLRALVVSHQLTPNAAVESKLKRAVAAPNVVNPLPAITALKTWAPNVDADDPNLGTLIALIEQCAREYIIFASVRSSELRGIKLVLSTSFERPAGNNGALPLLRIALGLKRRDHLFPLQRAMETPSYHFQLRTPRGLYVHEQHLRMAKSTGSGQSVSAKQQIEVPDADARASQSTKLVHVYLRGQSISHRGARTPTLRVNLRERPPGLLEVSLFVSLGLTMLVWIVGVNHEEVFAQRPPRGAWPTVLFGIPTLVSGWIFARLDAASMAKVSMLTLFACAWLLANSCLAVTAVAFKSGGVELTSAVVTYHGLSTTHPLWAGVMISCALHTIMACFLSFARGLRYVCISIGLTNTGIPEHYERS